MPFFLKVLWPGWGFPGGSAVKNLSASAGDARCGLDPWVGKIPWRRKEQSAPAFLPGKFHGQRSLAGYRTWGPKESDTTEHACRHTYNKLQINETQIHFNFKHVSLGKFIVFFLKGKYYS